MKLVDLRPGTIAYHRCFVTWGQATVVRIAPASPLEWIFERRLGRWRIVCKFENHDGETRLPPTALVRKPDKKRIKFMRERGYEFKITMPET